MDNGTYTAVYDDGTYTTIRVRDGEGKFQGKTFVEYMSGPDNERSFTAFGFLTPNDTIRVWHSKDANGKKKFRDPYPPQVVAAGRAFNVVLRNPHAAGQAYALRSGNCYRCDRKLTVPLSIESGIGPECAKALGIDRKAS